MSGAYYNENDGPTAAWLRELIKAGLIADGEVDERSIEEIQPADVVGFTQCHWFAGIGVWSYALRQAGWSDDRKVWTGSCPCPPFSSAGKKKACPQCSGTNPVPHVGRTGYFVCCLCDHEWFADARHLWPELWRLVRDGRPDCFFGEQVASGDGRTWFTSVRASLEILGYAVGGADICSAGVGAPHRRQRIYFVADSASKRYDRRRTSQARRGAGELERLRDASELGHAEGNGRYGRQDDGYGRRRECSLRQASQIGELADANSAGRAWKGQAQPEERGRDSVAIGRSAVGVAQGDTNDPRLQGRGLLEPGGRREGERQWTTGPSGVVNGFWAAAEWVYCRDKPEGKYRAIEPRSFPLASGAAARILRLRGYGNSLTAPVAEAFIRAYMELGR
jgi:DNA (cytosine-5)-methyltransferase 1